MVAMVPIIKSIFVLIAIATALQIFAIIVGGYYINEVKNQSELNAQKINQTVAQLTNDAETNNIRGNTTFYLLKATLDKTDRNYVALINATNQTNTLVKFLSDNFGENSDYLDKENFQYQQANDTFDIVKQILNQTR
jgi:hypothetical protein